jgi:hypothetical protein
MRYRAGRFRSGVRDSWIYRSSGERGPGPRTEHKPPRTARRGDPAGQPPATGKRGAHSAWGGRFESCRGAVWRQELMRDKVAEKGRIWNDLGRSQALRSNGTQLPYALSRALFCA